MFFRYAILLTLPLILFSCTLPPASAEPVSVEVKGAVEKPAKWTADSLRKQFTSEIKTINYTSRDQKHSATCIALFIAFCLRLRCEGSDAMIRRQHGRQDL